MEGDLGSPRTEKISVWILDPILLTCFSMSILRAMDHYILHY